MLQLSIIKKPKVDQEDLEESSFINSRCPILVKKDQDTSIDQEDFAEDVPDVDVIKVKVKVG